MPTTTTTKPTFRFYKRNGKPKVWRRDKFGVWMIVIDKKKIRIFRFLFAFPMSSVKFFLQNKSTLSHWAIVRWTKKEVKSNFNCKLNSKQQQRLNEVKCFFFGHFNSMIIFFFSMTFQRLVCLHSLNNERINTKTNANFCCVCVVCFFFLLFSLLCFL